MVLTVELRRVRSGQPEDVPRVVDGHGLHPEAETERRHLLLACVSSGFDLAFDTALPEPAGEDDAIEVTELLGHEHAFDVVGHDPVDLEVDLVGDRGVAE